MHEAILNLPVIIEVDDYHEFDYVEQHLQQMNKKIKIEEIGYDAPNYIGIVYMKKDKDCRKLAEEFGNEED